MIALNPLGALTWIVLYESRLSNVGNKGVSQLKGNIDECLTIELDRIGNTYLDFQKDIVTPIKILDMIFCFGQL